LGFLSSNPPASSDAIALGSAAHFNLSTVGEPASMSDRRFNTPPLWGYFSRPVAWPTSRRAEKILIPKTMISLSLRRSQSPPKQVVDLALGDGGDGVSDNGDDVNEVNLVRNTRNGSVSYEANSAFVDRPLPDCRSVPFSAHRPRCRSLLHTLPTTHNIIYSGHTWR
jgi:hypothetical protein